MGRVDRTCVYIWRIDILYSVLFTTPKKNDYQISHNSKPTENDIGIKGNRTIQCLPIEARQKKGHTTTHPWKDPLLQIMTFENVVMKLSPYLYSKSAITITKQLVRTIFNTNNNNNV